MLQQLKKIGEFVSPIVSIIAATSAFWYFILYENIEIQYKTRIETLKVKNDALKDDRARLEGENEKLTLWLKETPNSIPYFEKHINKKDSIINYLSQIINNNHIDFSNLKNNDSKKYQFTKKLKEGETFIDPLTQSSLAIFEISIEFKASAIISLPNKSSKKTIIVEPGNSWVFNYKKDTYKLILQKIDPLYDEFTVNLIQL